MPRQRRDDAELEEERRLRIPGNDEVQPGQEAYPETPDGRQDDGEDDDDHGRK